MPRVAVIGGGVCGLACAIRLAEGGAGVSLFEAAPAFGGRAGSFFDPALQGWFDHGPHLLIGAYRALRRLLADCGAQENIVWQPALRLPLWDAERGRFALAPSSRLPLAAALPLALQGLPGHGRRSAWALLRMGISLRRSIPAGMSVAQWLARWSAPPALVRDLIEPLCLGAMNEGIAHAPAASFAKVLRESFASQDNARLGWFRAPLRDALIAPLLARAQALGVRLAPRSLVRREALMAREIHGQRFDRIVLALPAPQRDRLLGRAASHAVGAIHNQHFWFDQPIHPSDGQPPFTGGIGTQGQWFFDVSAQMQRSAGAHGLQHVCIVISDARRPVSSSALLRELAEICGLASLPVPIHARTVRQKRATVLVRATPAPALPDWVIDAGESPRPGELPATIETAVRRGEQAARRALAPTAMAAAKKA